MTKSLDYIKLMEKNPITRLSKDYQSSLLTKIKKRFEDTEQQLFVANFYCYLNYNSKNDFVIDFDGILKWIGITRKDNVKKLLEKYFIENIDYKTLLRQVAEQNSENRGGYNKEQILYTHKILNLIYINAK
jgi:hypothetical protein